MEENKNEEKLINNNNKKEQEYIELKEVDNYEEPDETKEKNETPEEIKKEEKDEEKTKLKSENEDKISTINDDDSESSSPVGKKIMKIILLNLNSYWISIIATVSLIVTMLIYEALGIYYNWCFGYNF